MAPSGSSISVKYIVLAAAIIGTFQAVTWFSLSLVSILFYESAIENDQTSNDGYGYCIYELYLNKNNNNIQDFIIYPKTFNYFMFIYLVLSFIWLIASCFIIWAVFRKKWKCMTNLMIFWSTVTIAMAIIDIILMSLVAVDLQKAHDTFTPTTPSAITTGSSITDTTITTISYEAADNPVENFVGRSLEILETTSNTVTKETIYTSMGIVMSVAARGYVLWVVNVTFAIMLIVLVQKIRKTNRPTLLPAIDAYATGPRPFTLYEQTDIGSGHNNNGFNLDENIIFSPRHILDHRAENIPKNPLSNSNRSSINNSQPQIFEAARPVEIARPIEIARPFKGRLPPSSKVAKIGRSGGGQRTPPRNVPSPVLPNNVPFIPDPDYTPPASPSYFQPKSVLRAKSKYDQ